MRLALVDLFHARWSNDIHDEWTRNVAANRPDISPKSLARCRRLMDEHSPDSLITGYELLIPRLSLPDPDDRHVLAAAIHGGVKLIVTFNLDDFPASALAPYSIEAVHPDDFIAGLFDEAPDVVIEVVRRQREGLKNPPRSAAELLGTLEQCGLKETVARLRSHLSQSVAGG
jgi:hypothetical protein